MEEEKQMAMEDRDSQNGDITSLMYVLALFEQFILLLTQVFNATSYLRRKSIIDTLIDDKLKVKETLKEQSDSLNNFSNQFLFHSYFENEFSKSRIAKQRSRSLFTGRRKPNACRKSFNKRSLGASQMLPFQGSSFSHRPMGGCSSCLQEHSNVEVSSVSLTILFPVRLLNQRTFQRYIQ